MKVLKIASRMAPWSVKIRRSVGWALRRELDGPGTAADRDGMREPKRWVKNQKRGCQASLVKFFCCVFKTGIRIFLM